MLLSTQVYKWVPGRMWRICCVFACNATIGSSARNAYLGVEIVHCMCGLEIISSDWGMIVCFVLNILAGWICAHYNIQLTNWTLWNGKFYYRDVIEITITQAKDEGNGHFYHIEVIDLPFHIPFVSCFISLIDNTKKKKYYWKFTSKFGIIVVLQSLLGSLF